MYKFIAMLTLGLWCTSCQKASLSQPGALVPLTVDQNPSLPSRPINGTLLHVEDVGNPADPLLVVVHGGPGGDYRSMLHAKDLAKDGFHVVLYDQRGSGLSKREPASQYTSKAAVQLFIDDLGALIDHFQSNSNQKVFLLGHSWGAMLATAYINQHPERISGAILAEPGGLTWPQTSDYLSRSNKIKFFEEALNDAIFPEQFFDGCSDQEILDYKASFFSNYENAPGNSIGNAGPYPFWRSGAVAFDALIDNAERFSFDFTTQLQQFQPKVLFLYSQLNTAYGLIWAQKVSAPYPHVELKEVINSGHEMLYFGWNDFYPKALTYLNELK